MKRVHFTINAHKKATDQILQELSTLLPCIILEEASQFLNKAQRSRHSKGKGVKTEEILNINIKNNELPEDKQNQNSLYKGLV